MRWSGVCDIDKVKVYTKPHIFRYQKRFVIVSNHKKRKKKKKKEFTLNQCGTHIKS